MSRRAVLVLCVILLSSIVTADDSPSAYEVLQSYNFPMGLLPKGALGYDLDEDSGKFNAYLNGSCGFSLEGSYQLKYKSTISGYISQNKLKNLSGISVKVLFLWLNIVEVTRGSDDLEFSVGIASADFPIDNFLECPQCGCGLDCVNGQCRHARLIQHYHPLASENESNKITSTSKGRGLKAVVAVFQISPGGCGIKSKS